MAPAYATQPPPDAVNQLAGQRVRDWRRRQRPPLSQPAFAKRAGISLGCLQAFERGARQTRESNVARIAAVLGLTAAQLLDADTYAPTPPDPLLTDLRREDLRLAQAFHHAGAHAKYAITLFFSGDFTEEDRERIGRLLVKVMTAREMLDRIEAFYLAWERTEPPANHQHGSGGGKDQRLDNTGT
jgi:transcriptional regulator with XRE-family HTH domain